MEKSSNHPQRTFLLDYRILGLTLPVAAVLAITLCGSLLWSHFMLLNLDEIMVLQTDTNHSLARLIQIQTSVPISLDPLLFHSVVHCVSHLTSSQVAAVRLPSVVGFLLMQVCLYIFVRRGANERTALVAVAVPALTSAYFYSVEGRPYGLLLGLFAAAAASWQYTATHSRERTIALVVLGSSIAGSLNTHFYGVLILVPLCCAEGWRTVRLRKVDIPVLASIFLGACSILAVIPIAKAVRVFREHYYNVSRVPLSFVISSYRDAWFGSTHSGRRTMLVVAASLICLFALLAFHFAQGKLQNLRFTESEYVLIAAFTLLPLFGFAFGRFVTKSIETRSVLALTLGIAFCLSIGALPYLQRDSSYALITVVTIGSLLVTVGIRVRGAQRSSQAERANLSITPNVAEQLQHNPDQYIYLQNLDWFERASVNEPDRKIESHLALLYSRQQELSWTGHDTMSITAMHLTHFTNFPIVDYASLMKLRGDHILVLYNDEWAWTTQALSASHAKVRPLGAIFGGEAVLVTFPNQ